MDNSNVNNLLLQARQLIVALTSAAESTGAPDGTRDANPVNQSLVTAPRTVGQGTTMGSAGSVTPVPVTSLMGRSSICAQPFSSPITAELRSRFSPYGTAPLGGRRSRRSNAPPSVTTPTNLGRPNLINLSFYCLDSPDQAIVPSAEEASQLQQCGFGFSALEIDRCGSVEELKEKIWSEFPLNRTEFELLIRINQTRLSPLGRISKSCAVPAPAMLISRRYGTIYVRPLDNTAGASPNATPATPMRRSCAATVTSDSPGLMESENEFNSPMTYERGAGTSSDEGLLVSSPNASTITTASTSAGGFPFIPNSLRLGPVLPISTITEDLGSTSPLLGFRDVESYRLHLHESYPGVQQLIINRELLIQSLLSYYKDPKFDYKRQTQVHFTGEWGCDVEGLTKELFTLVMLEFRDTKIMDFPLIEGEADHYLPVANQALLSSGVYRLFGKFLAHAAIQSGIGFAGMSRAVVLYLLQTEENGLIPISIDDVPDYDSRILLGKLLNIDAASAEESDQIKRMLATANIFVRPTTENSAWCLQEFLRWVVIGSRTIYLEQIKEGMKDTTLLRFIQIHPELWESLFPLEEELKPKPNVIVGAIDYEGTVNPALKATLIDSIYGLDQENLRKLLICWTGSLRPPVTGLTVSFSDAGELKMYVCFSTLSIPTTMKDDELILGLRTALEYGTYGFGTI